jgi:hypothetical protein
MNDVNRQGELRLGYLHSSGCFGSGQGRHQISPPTVRSEIEPIGGSSLAQ